MLTAEYGGSGGKAIESGLVVEEPDIEIGAGVSSKGKSSLDYQPRKEANDATQQSADGWPPIRAARLALGLRARDQKWARATVDLTEATTTNNARLTLSESRPPFQDLAFNFQTACPCFRLASSYQVSRLLSLHPQATLVDAPLDITGFLETSSGRLAPENPIKVPLVPFY